MKYLTTLSILILIYSCNQQTPVKELDHLPFQIDVSNLHFNKSFTYRMSVGGDSLGYSKISYLANNNNVSVREDAEVMVNGQPFVETMQTLLTADFKLIAGNINGEISGFPIDVNFSWVGDSVIGYSKFPDHPKVPKIEVDTTLNAKVVDRLTSLFLYPAMQPLATGYTSNYDQFNLQDAQVRRISLEVLSEEKVNTPVGEYDTYKVKLTGGAANQILFIDKNVPRKIVAIRFDDLDWEYDLISVD